MSGASRIALEEDGLARLRRENEEQFPSQVLEIDSHSHPADRQVLPFPQQHTLEQGELSGTGEGWEDGGGDHPLAALDDDGDVKAALEALYGYQFPLLNSNHRDDDWIDWANGLWTQGSSGVQAMLHLVERNRLYYKGVQWVSAAGFGPWREPPKPRDVVRTVRNYIKPALDMRTQLLAEQRPGFACTPASGDPKAAQRAEADQVALEWSWHEQQMDRIATEAGYHVGTDGVCFLHLYWDPDAGPWYEIPRLVPPEGGIQYPMGKKPGQKFPLGDIRTKVHSIEQVRVSADAKANKEPMIWIVREVIPRMQAVMEHGKGVAHEMGHAHDETDDDMQHVAASRHGFILPRQDELYRDMETVARITVYCKKSEFLPKGLTLVVVGEDLAVAPTALPYGRVPLVRWTDGSPDPSFYPMPVMVDWLDAQQRINSVVSKLIESIRKGANANLIARGNTLSHETLIGGTLSVYEVKAPQGVPLSEIVQPIGPFEIAQSALGELAQETKVIEDLTGYNDATRGSFSGDTSGRAILAVREQVERVFAPFVNAASRAMCDWAEIVIAMMKENYDLPRMVAVEGSDRPDLARLLTNDDLDVAAQVWVDPETLMPMPRSLKLAVLDDLLQKQQMNAQEYRRRMPFAMVRSIESPDQDQKARAERIAEAIRREGSDQKYAILWMDDEAQHQDVLERRILFDDSLADNVRAVAYERWMQLAAQAQEKAQGMALPPGEPQQAQPQQQAMAQPPSGGALPGQTTSTGLQGANRFMGPQHAASGPMSPVASTPLTQIGQPDQLQAAARFERTQPQ